MNSATGRYFHPYIARNNSVRQRSTSSCRLQSVVAHQHYNTALCDAPVGLVGTTPSIDILGTGCVRIAALDDAVDKL